MRAAAGSGVYPRLGPTAEWDTAAVRAVLTAACGALATTSREPPHCNTTAEILAPSSLPTATEVPPGPVCSADAWPSGLNGYRVSLSRMSDNDPTERKVIGRWVDCRFLGTLEKSLERFQGISAST